MLQRLERADAAVELPPLLQIVERAAERLLGDAAQRGGEHGAADVERAFQRLRAAGKLRGLATSTPSKRDARDAPAVDQDAGLARQAAARRPRRATASARRRSSQRRRRRRRRGRRARNAFRRRARSRRPRALSLADRRPFVERARRSPCAAGDARQPVLPAARGEPPSASAVAASTAVERKGEGASVRAISRAISPAPTTPNAVAAMRLGNQHAAPAHLGAERQKSRENPSPCGVARSRRALADRRMRGDRARERCPSAASGLRRASASVSVRGQFEQALGDDVEHDFRRAALDRIALRAQPALARHCPGPRLPSK